MKKDNVQAITITNRQYLIEQLEDPNFIDDGGASYGTTIYHNIACPYIYGDKRALCYEEEIDNVNREMCFKCKEKWLNSEV